ncbi:hypothetical protein AAE478_009606 [Parahypoxylon ruwenzoriense]
MAPLRSMPAPSPTRTLPRAISGVIAARQQAPTAVVAQENGEATQTLSGGAIAGIVIGSIAGFLLLLWVIRSCGNLGHPGIWGATFEPDNEKPPSSRGPHRTSVVSVTRPVYVEQRGRSPRAPPPVYYSDSRDLRRSNDGRGYRH